jgi:type II secretory pathway pseudopilin PulG
MHKRSHSNAHFRSENSARGFTLIVALAAMFFLALAMQQVMQVVSVQAQREREAELLRIGKAYAHAIKAYHDSSSGVIKSWPLSLNELLDDRRTVGVQRHLRRLYADPMTRTVDWGLVSSPDGIGIMGIYSRSDAAPIRTGGADVDALGFQTSAHYSDWKFVATP